MCSGPTSRAVDTDPTCRRLQLDRYGMATTTNQEVEVGVDARAFGASPKTEELAHFGFALVVLDCHLDRLAETLPMLVVA